MSSSRRGYRQPGWFQGAPLTKFVCFVTGLCYAILKNGLTDLIALDLQDLVEHAEFYRLFLYPISFGSIGETILGLAVLTPLMKRFEREFGTRNFAAFLAKATFFATAFQLLFLSDHYLATGPYPIIGTTLYLYNSLTPRLYPKFISILGFDFSEKAVTYFFTLQVIFSQGYYSIIPFASGYVAGILCTSKMTPIGKWNPDLPQFVYNMGLSIGRATGLADLSITPSFVGSQRTNNRSMGMGGIGVRRTQRGNDGAGTNMPVVQPRANPEPQPQQMFQPDPPSPEAIEQLTAMGFERDAVIRALREADNNLEHAANRLLTS
mmetsp:Transcript_4561/g.5246  ORF Transcript_4561/g.5246 Transcript_4561/m.5246 type:complete len:321 (+) Transcript_4561:32-994(+)